MEEAVKAELAQRLSEAPAPPTGLSRALAADSISVAAPILRSSRALTDDDLLHVARTQGQDHLRAISQRSSVSSVACIEFNHVPAHVFSNGPCDRRFSNAWGSNEENGFLLRRSVLPFIEPSSNFPTLDFISFEQLFGPRAMALRPIAGLTHG